METVDFWESLDDRKLPPYPSLRRPNLKSGISGTNATAEEGCLLTLSFAEYNFPS
jgi:hypothetical protein